jgi:hypothetical protein
MALPEHRVVVGTQSAHWPFAMQASEQARDVVVTRSSPQVMDTFSEQKVSPETLPTHPATIGRQSPWFSPGAVSHSSVSGHVECTDQVRVLGLQTRLTASA